MLLPSRRPRFNPWVRKIRWRRKWQLTPAFLLGNFYGQRPLAMWAKDFPLFFSFQSLVALYFFFTFSLKMIICLVFPFTSLFYLASLVAQLIKNLPAMQKIWVWFLGWEDPLEKGKATHSSILAWKIPWTVYSPWGCKMSSRIDRLSLSFTMFSLLNITYKSNRHKSILFA